MLPSKGIISGLMFTDEQIVSRILLKLFRHGKWGGAHTSFENLKKGWSNRDLGKEGLRRIDKLVKELVKEGLILTKPTHYGVQVGLNPRYSQEILQKIKQFFPEA